MANQSMPSAGEAAPDFQGKTQNGEIVRLSDYRGQKVALYFYPEDDTPGCTKQACNLRDGIGRLKKAGIAVIGVSKDDVNSHRDFADKYDLPFPLVADPEKKILDKYGVWGERSMFGNKYMGTKRTTFLIDEEGDVVHVFRRPKTEEHTTEVLEKFQTKV